MTKEAKSPQACRMRPAGHVFETSGIKCCNGNLIKGPCHTRNVNTHIIYIKRYIEKKFGKDILLKRHFDLLSKFWVLCDMGLWEPYHTLCA